MKAKNYGIISPKTLSNNSGPYISRQFGPGRRTPWAHSVKDPISKVVYIGIRGNPNSRASPCDDALTTRILTSKRISMFTGLRG